MYFMQLNADSIRRYPPYHTIWNIPPYLICAFSGRLKYKGNFLCIDDLLVYRSISNAKGSNLNENTIKVKLYYLALKTLKMPLKRLYLRDA